MIIYPITFILSSLFFYLGENLKKNKKTYMFIGIAIPILIATIRAESVGIDVLTYMKPLYLCSKGADSLTDFFHDLKSTPALEYLDYGYALIGYFATKIFHGLWGIFLVNAILCIVPVYLGLKYFNNYFKKINYPQIPIWLGMLTYLVIFYNNSLNQVRQIIVCGLLFLAVSLLLNKKIFVPILLFLFCLTIHISALIFLIFLMIIFISWKQNKILNYISFIFLIAFFFFGRQIFYLVMYILQNLKIIPDKYLGEIFNVEYLTFDLNITWFIISLALLFVMVLRLYIYKKTKYNVGEKFPFIDFMLFFISLCFFSLFPFASYFISFGRLQLYFFIYAVLIIPMIPFFFKTKIPLDNQINLLPVVLLLLFYWVVGVGLTDFTGTLNYLFFWQ